MKLKLLLIILVCFVSVCFVNAQTPVASFQANDTAICQSNCITFTNNSTNATSYQWSFPGGTPSTSPFSDPGSVCYAATGSYDVTLIASNGSNADTLKLHNYIIVSPLPTLQLTGGPLCNPSKLDWAQWTSVSSSTASGKISSSLTMSVTQSGGGLSTTPGMFDPSVFPTQYNVPVSSTAIKNVNAGIFTFCFSEPVIDPQIALSSIGSGSLNVQVTTSAPYQIIWAGPGMTYANDTTMAGQEGYTIIQFPGVQSCISFNYHTAEDYCNLAFGVLDTNCQATTIPPLCSGDSVTLTATGNVVLHNSYSWAPSAGLSTDTGAVVKASPSQTTTYSVTCTSGNCSVTDTVVVTIIPSPTVSISGLDTICHGVVDTLKASGTGIASLAWNAGSTTSAIVANANSTASYTVTATASNSCTASAQTTVKVNPTPTTSISGDTAFCNGASTTLNAGNGFSSYQWSTGGSAETINADTGGHYSVIVTDSHGCTTTASKTVSANPNPTPSISGTTTFCSGNSTALDAGGGFAIYRWSTGNTSESIGTDTSGSYMVTVTDGNGCTGTASATVTVNPNPMPSISGITAFCSGDSTTLDAGGGFAIYQWSTGDSGESIGTDTSGSYMVTVTDGNGCKGTASKTVTVNSNPTTSVSGTTAFCSGDSATLDAGNGFSSYQWSTGGADETINVDTGGNYSVIVTDGNGCTTTASAIVTVNSNPRPSISGATNLCAGDTSTLDAGGGFYIYQWSTGDAGETISTDTSGSYTVTVTDGNDCIGTASAIVTVNPNPTPSISGVTTFCSGDSTTLDAGGGFAIYQWSTGDANEIVSADTSGNYTVTVTDSNGCMGTASTTVAVNPSPTTSISGTTTFCSGDSATLDAGNGFSSYQWSTGGPDETIDVDTGGNYSVIVTDGNGCSTTASTRITVNPNPTPSISGVTNFCAGDTSTLDAGGGFITYQWSTGDASETISTDTSGSYIVTVADGNGCVGTASATVTVHSLPVVAISGNASFCPGDSTTLDAGRGYISYAWSTGSSDETITVDTAGNYSVIIADGNGCSGTTSTLVTENSSPHIPFIYQLSADTLVCRADTSYRSYQWYDNTILIPSATDTFLMITHEGIYYVQVTNADGCSSTQSINVITTGVEDISGNSFSLYPNPSAGQFTININTELKNGIIEIYNTLGEKMYAESFIGKQKDIAFNSAAGIYFVQVKSDNGTLMKKLLIR